MAKRHGPSKCFENQCPNSVAGLCCRRCSRPATNRPCAAMPPPYSLSRGRAHPHEAAVASVTALDLPRLFWSQPRPSFFFLFTESPKTEMGRRTLYHLSLVMGKESSGGLKQGAAGEKFDASSELIYHRSNRQDPRPRKTVDRVGGPTLTIG